VSSSDFHFLPAESGKGGSGMRQPQRGQNTVVGRFSVDAQQQALDVSFDRVELLLDTDGMVTAETRMLAKPACARLHILLMTPSRTVTHSNMRSVAVLRRCADEPVAADERPVCVPHSPPDTAAALALLLSHGGSAIEVAELYVACASIDSAGELLGTWAGEELPSGNPLDGQLTAAGWFGKRFDSLDAVFPLLFKTGGPPLALDPRRVLAIPAGLPGTLVRLLTPLLATEAPGARLRMMVDPYGDLTACMIYDGAPIIDSFKRVDQNTLLGMMDARGAAAPFFFVLRRC
jgi:hypothetical protein